MNTDQIVEKIEIKAPVTKVWNALTDHRKFGKWFRVEIDGPFVVGEVSLGQMTVPGFEHFRWEAVIQKMEPESLFSYTWHPYADPSLDLTEEPATLVEFRLSKSPTGTLLTVTESGFDKLPEGKRRIEAYRMNSQGWIGQGANLKRYVESASE